MAVTITDTGRRSMYQEICDEMIGRGMINIFSLDYPVMQVVNNLELSGLIMRGHWPIRLYASIHWGQGKAAAELDCQRRLREMGR